MANWKKLRQASGFNLSLTRMESTRLSEKWKLRFSRASKRRRIRRREMRSWSSGRVRLDSWRGFQWIDLRREERRGEGEGIGECLSIEIYGYYIWKCIEREHRSE